MSKLQELCARLTERGVEYTIAGRGYVMWQANKGEFMAFEHDGALSVCLLGSVTLSLEEAIRATLGPGTCHLEDIELDCDTASEYMLDREWCFDAVYRCSCGYRFGHVAHNRPRYCPSCGAKVVP